jgi:phosphoribosylaminoimidazolecarboxamide formyltransferase / IMP cyclohydrolase
VKRALLSVSDKSGIIDFAKALSDLGYEILSTGGTAKALREGGLTIIEVANYTGFPEILDGRVKTLHPKIHGGLLGRRHDSRHLAEMAKHEIGPIDVLAVNLYPFEATIRAAGCTFEEAIENIDIGGPSMLRSGAKNHADVTVIVDPADYPKVREALRKGGVPAEMRRDLALKVFQHTAHYDGMIASYLDTQTSDGMLRFPSMLALYFQKVQNLRYGENPHQQAAFYRDIAGIEPAAGRARQLHGKEMSYNNFLDVNSALELAKECPVTTAVIVKHNNPCGVAVGASPREAYALARETDPVSAFGGVVAFNAVVDLAAAKELTATFLEVVVAPGFDAEALAELKRKKDLRLLEVGSLQHRDRNGLDRMDMKKIVGGLLLQERDLGVIPDIRALKIASKRPPTEEEYDALAFAWTVCKHVKSNAIVFSRSQRTIGIGAGQMSRVDAVKLAILKAASPVRGCVMASDAFFPFRDGIDAAAEAGVTAVVQPGGSIRDQEVIHAVDEHDMAMVLTAMRHFRH